MEEARAALMAADVELTEAQARWSLINHLTGKAHRVSAATRQQRQQNHLGDLFAHALGEG